MKIKGQEYKLVYGNCEQCAFIGDIYGGCDLDVGQMKDEESCFSIENQEKIYKEVKI